MSNFNSSLTLIIKTNNNTLVKIAKEIQVVCKTNISLIKFIRKINIFKQAKFN